MATFILDDATGIGSDDLNSAGAFVDLAIIANDDGIGIDDPVGGMQRGSPTTERLTARLSCASMR